MRWISGVIGAVALAAAGAASAATFTVEVSAPPTYFDRYPGKLAAAGSASFPDVLLHVGDTLQLTVDFGAPLNVQGLESVNEFYSLNVWRGQSQGAVLITYPWGAFLNVPTGATGFSTYATVYQVYGPPDTTTFFDVNTVSYEFDPAPEPAAWAVMLLGVFGVGAATRRARRRVIASSTSLTPLSVFDRLIGRLPAL